MGKALCFSGGGIKAFAHIGALKALEEKFTGLINENGKVEEVIDLGKRKLAYEIKKNKEAYYVQINFESKPEAIAELERIYRITDGILKFITVRK